MYAWHACMACIACQGAEVRASRPSNALAKPGILTGFRAVQQGTPCPVGYLGRMPSPNMPWTGQRSVRSMRVHTRLPSRCMTCKTCKTSIPGVSM